MTLFYKAIARVFSYYLNLHIAVIASHFVIINLVVKSDCAVKDECCFFPHFAVKKCCLTCLSHLHQVIQPECVTVLPAACLLKKKTQRIAQALLIVTFSYQWVLSP